MTETLSHGPPEPSRWRVERVLAIAVAAHLAVAVSAVIRHSGPPAPVLPEARPSGRVPGEAGRSSALHAARVALTAECPDVSPASDESFRAGPGFRQVVYTIWVERPVARASRFAVLLVWRDGGYDYVVTTAPRC